MVLLMVTTCSFNQFLLRNLHKTSSHGVSKCLTSIWHTRVMSEPFLRIRSVGGGRHLQKGRHILSVER